MLRAHKRISLEVGDNVTLLAVGDSYTTFEGFKEDNVATIGLSLKSFSCTPGDDVLISEGQIVVKITEVISETEVRGISKSSKKLGERKHCNIPFAKQDTEGLMHQLADDLQGFVLNNKADFVSAFAQSADDILLIKQMLGHTPGSTEGSVLARIENAEALRNIDSILEAADGIILGRGLLAREIRAEKVALAQKWCITKARLLGKLALVSDEILDSMITNPRPTRAEMTDAANAVLDGADGLVLVKETGIGMFSADAVSTIGAIARNAELGVRGQAATRVRMDECV